MYIIQKTYTTKRNIVPHTKSADNSKEFTKFINMAITESGDMNYGIIFIFRLV